MAKNLISNLEKVTITGILNAEDMKIENDGEEILLEQLFDNYSGYDIEIKLSREIAHLNIEE